VAGDALQTVRDKTAFITGGASGIGLGMAQAFVAAGMRVVIADVRPEALRVALAALDAGPRVYGVQLDVTDRAAFSAAADEVERNFGPVHVLCNNAGVGMLGSIKSTTYDDWDWCLSVNLGGVVNGIQTFLPRMLAHRQGGHVVNTSSIGAVAPGPGGAPYLASKGAIHLLSEGLKLELLEDNIGVTVLFPGPTQTQINKVADLRPARYRDTGLADVEAQLAAKPLFDNGLDPRVVGDMVLDAIRRDLLFVFTHNEFREGVARRFEAILQGFPDGPVDAERAQGFGFALIPALYGEILARNAPPAGSKRQT